MESPFNDIKQGEWRLSCDNEKTDPKHGKSLLVSFYPNQNKSFSSDIKNSLEKLNDFSSFLPLKEEYDKLPLDISSPICFKSINLEKNI